MSVREIIMQRKSIRTYKEEPIPQELVQKLINYIEDVKAPLNTKIRFKIINLDNISSGVKLGTYGVIKGAKTFICSAVEKEKRYEENLGYTFEKIILYATSLGLGTCWLGGTFKRGEFGKAINLKESEFMPVIAPIGYAKENRSFLDSLMVLTTGAKNRKGWSKLFFDKNFNNAIEKEESGKFEEAFEMVRLAPSASNKQPWRIVKDGSSFHFFVCRSKGYAKGLNFDIQRLDIGIAMYHFESTLNELGIFGKWNDDNPDLTTDVNTEYIITYTIN